jgi:hypothetical protein
VTRLQLCGYHTATSVANRPKFLPQNTKVAPEKSQRPRKSAAKFYAEFPKLAEKRQNFFKM